MLTGIKQAGIEPILYHLLVLLLGAISFKIPLSFNFLTCKMSIITPAYRFILGDKVDRAYPVLGVEFGHDSCHYGALLLIAM